MAENKNPSDNKDKEPLLDDPSSEEESVNPELKTTKEERQGTIPVSVQVRVMDLMCGSHTQANPIVKRGAPIKTHKKKNKNPQSKATQTKNQG